MTSTNTQQRVKTVSATPAAKRTTELSQNSHAPALLLRKTIFVLFNSASVNADEYVLNNKTSICSKYLKASALMIRVAVDMASARNFAPIHATQNTTINLTNTTMPRISPLMAGVMPVIHWP